MADEVLSWAWSQNRDLRKAATELGPDEARFLVTEYYAAQERRKANVQREFKVRDAGRPSLLLERLAEDSRQQEDNIKYALSKWGERDPVARWARSIMGIGPVIAAGLSAHIDIKEAPTVGHIWSFAGLLDPKDQPWNKGEKRPWNADLKTLCWKIGESFVKVSNNEKDVYGHIYNARKDLEIERNDEGLYAEQAAAILLRVPGHAQRATYKLGKLPAGHLHSRAKRYAVKLFLAHWHHVAFEVEFNEKPPKPYILTDQAALKGLGQHVHFIAPPNWPMAA